MNKENDAFTVRHDMMNREITIEMNGDYYAELSYGSGINDVDEFDTLVKLWVKCFGLTFDGEWRTANATTMIANLVYI